MFSLRSLAYGLLLSGVLALPAKAQPVADFYSALPGMQLWQLQVNPQRFPAEYFANEDEAWADYCDGIHTVYLTPDNLALRCLARSQATGYEVSLRSHDPALAGLVIVSRQPFPEQRMVEKLTPKDRAFLRPFKYYLQSKASRQARQAYRRAYPVSDPRLYDAVLRNIEREPGYQHSVGLEYKFVSGQGVVYLLPLGAYPQGMGWDMLSVVLSLRDGELQNVGEVHGCVQGYFDIDGDRVAEILTRRCENSQGSEDVLWQIYPEIKPLLSRSQ